MLAVAGNPLQGSRHPPQTRRLQESGAYTDISHLGKVLALLGKC